MKSKTPMTSDEIAARMGWEGVELELIEHLDAPPSPDARGLVTTTALPPAQFVGHMNLHGVDIARYVDEPWCIAVSAVPWDSGGSSHPLEGGVALDGRSGDAWGCFALNDADFVLYNSKGELSLLRVETSPVIRALRALSQPVVEFEATLPSVDELVRVARESPSTPAWLAQATEARAGDELVQRLDAIGLVARHAYGPAVDSVRGWARALVAADTARLEQMILRHVERSYDALGEALDGDTFATHMLVYERDRLESLLALRSFAGMGSPVRESVRQLDDHVLGQLVLLPDPAPGAFEDDPSIAAADGLAPNAWWADYAR